MTERSEPISRSAGTERRVLIVEDDRDFAATLADILEPNGFSLSLASGVGEALAAAEATDAQVALLDIKLGSESGVELLAEFQQTRPCMQCILVTAYADVDTAIEAVRRGACDYLRKPLDPPKLVTVVDQAFRNHFDGLRRQRETHSLRARNQLLLSENVALRELTLMDSLTGIANRRGFDERLEREWQRAQRGKTPLAVVLADVDCFKAYNDSLGHPAGDRCLGEVAAILTRQVHRPGDLVARYGGEEFVVLLPSVTTRGALLVAERMRHAVEGLRIRHPASTVADFITVSAGAASIRPEAGSASQELLEVADHMLYQAKEGGRNRCAGTDE